MKRGQGKKKNQCLRSLCALTLLPQTKQNLKNQKELNPHYTWLLHDNNSFIWGKLELHCYSTTCKLNHKTGDPFFFISITFKCEHLYKRWKNMDQ